MISFPEGTAPSPSDSDQILLTKILLQEIANGLSGGGGHFDPDGNIQVYDPDNNVWLTLTAPSGILTLS